MKTSTATLLAKLIPMDQEAKDLVDKIQNTLAEICSDLYQDTTACASIEGQHPVDRILEYTMLHKRIIINMTLLEYTVKNLQRRAEKLSQEARQLIREELWSDEIRPDKKASA